MNKVIAFSGGEGASAEYRIKQPARFIDRYYEDITVDVRDKVNIEESNKHAASLWQRQSSKETFEIMYELKRNGQYIAYDIDDDLFSADIEAPDSSWYYNNMTKEGQTRLHNLKVWMQQVDELVVTTEHLKDRLSGINKNITVIPNSIDVDLFEMKEKEDSKDIILGWTGSATHYPDLKTMYQAVVDVVNRHDNVKLLTSSYENIDFWPGINPDKVIKMPWTEFKDYPNALRQIDIGLCPLKDSLFNRSKSNLKYIELGALGIPAICSKVEPYSKTIEQGIDGILVKAKGAVYKKWVDAMETLIADEKLRKRIAVNAHYKVLREYNQNLVVTQWADFYRRISNERSN